MLYDGFPGLRVVFLLIRRFFCALKLLFDLLDFCGKYATKAPLENNLLTINLLTFNMFAVYLDTLVKRIPVHRQKEPLFLFRYISVKALSKKSQYIRCTTPHPLLREKHHWPVVPVEEQPVDTLQLVFPETVPVPVLPRLLQLLPVTRWGALLKTQESREGFEGECCYSWDMLFTYHKKKKIPDPNKVDKKLKEKQKVQDR